MDTIKISAEWWCPKKRVPQTKKDLACELGQLAASHIIYDVTEYGKDGCLVRASLRVCNSTAYGKET